MEALQKMGPERQIDVNTPLYLNLNLKLTIQRNSQTNMFLETKPSSRVDNGGEIKVNLLK